MKKKRITIMSLLFFFIAIGSIVGFALNKNNHQNDHATAVHAQNGSLEDEFWNVDLIIQGTVIGQEETFQRDSGVKIKYDNSFPVTPAIVQVNKVLYGETDQQNITLLQHGSNDNKTDSSKMVKESENVILILTRTESGHYWSYNFEDGIWIMNNGKVKSQTQKEILTSGRSEQDLEKFIDKITAAAKNKRKPLTE
ncbi:hypothetical protein D3P07_12215 [Paenibacillus sp. 1011MAR3C5]|uniref:hypothetical protein n=1 Tax=Paenibacillus sp. 1011MAR3C5 TaxID=1675787 RepID=UPI000E6B72FB|nr:hypothetical protein [Paenibacillus sp. 1011MAR3C5]RJE88743.1 hypothetical protein D3P07_12215 [Paenibacillus sp. 1011MAR3C5]